jgi:hypothetical protein
MPLLLCPYGYYAPTAIMPLLLCPYCYAPTILGINGKIYPPVQSKSPDIGRL